MRLNDITYKVRGAVFEVYNILGPGLLESAYEAALAFEFVKLLVRAYMYIVCNEDKRCHKRVFSQAD